MRRAAAGCLCFRAPCCKEKPTLSPLKTSSRVAASQTMGARKKPFLPYKQPCMLVPVWVWMVFQKAT